MTIKQLNPTIPVHTDMGDGQAIAMLDYSSEHHLFWVVALDSNGEIWTLANPKVRLQKNITMGRMNDKKCD